MKIFIRFLLFALILCVPLSASGYILSAKFIIKMMLQANHRIHDVKIEQTATLFDEDADHEGYKAPSVLYLKFPDSLRLDITLSYEKETVIHSNGETLTVVDGNLVSEVPDVRSVLKEFFITRSVDEVIEFLHAKHVNTERMGLGRFNGKIVYIIGAKEWETESPQLWIEKDSFLPLRFIAEERKEDCVFILEVRYLDYKSIGRAYRYPSVIEFYHDNNLTLRYETENVVVNTSLPDSLFHMNRISENNPHISNNGKQEIH